MSVDTNPTQIKLPVESVFREGVNYRPTSSCIFYAVQEACQDLRGEGLGESEYQRFRRGINDLVVSEQERLGLTQEARGISVALSINFIVPYLHEKFIDVTRIFMLQQDIAQVQQIYPDPLKEYPFKAANKKRDYAPPFIALVQRPDGPHAFYVKDAQDFDTKYPIHMPQGGDFVAFICVQKAKKP